jgi:hypothetical protein
VIDARGDELTRPWSLRLLTGVLAGCVVLSGCSEKREANDSLPTASASPTEEELPPLGPEDLPMPDEARTQDAAGAEAFVRYYIDLINRTSDVMDAEPLREFSDGCQDCIRIARSVEEDARAGYSYEGGDITILEVTTPLLKDSTAEMALRVDQAALVVVDASGASIDNLTTDAYLGLSGGTSLRWDALKQSWVMTGLTLQ